MHCRTGKKKRRKWEVGFGETRWATARWGFFASFLLVIFSLLLLFAIGKKRAGREGKGLGGF
jgi:hypothetical protein